MKISPIDVVILVLYFVVLIAVAVFTRKNNKSIKDFLLAGNGIGGIMTAFAYGTSYFSSVIFIGYAGKNGYLYGLGALWIGLGNAAVGSLLAWQVLAKRTRRLTHFYGTRTMSEMIESRYNSKHLKLICAILIFVFLVPYAASVYQGLGYLFELVFGIPFWSVVLIMATIAAIYLFFGGYMATVLSDFFQGSIMIVGVIVMLAFVLNYEKVGGVVSGFDKLFSDNLGFFPSVSNANGSPNGYTLVMLVLLTSVGTWGLPQMIHKFYTIRAEKSIKSAKYVSTTFAFIIGVSAYLVGCVARYILGAAEVGGMVASGSEDKIIPNVLVEALPAGLCGLIVVLILSASVSTLAALTLTGSSAVAIDLYKGYIKKEQTEKKVNLLMRILCLVFIGVSVVIAILRPSGIINLMSLSWGTLAGCFLAPYFYGLYDKKATKMGAYSAIITGLGVTLVMYILFSVLPKPAALYFSPPAIGVYAMLLSMIVMPIVSRLKPNVPDSKVDELFSIMTQKGNAKSEG